MLKACNSWTLEPDKGVFACLWFFCFFKKLRRLLVCSWVETAKTVQNKTTTKIPSLCVHLYGASFAALTLPPQPFGFWGYSFQHQAQPVIFVNRGKCSHGGRYPPKTAFIWGVTGCFRFSDYDSVTAILSASIHTHTREQSARSHFSRGLWIGSKLSTHFSRNSELNPLEPSVPGWLSLDHGCHLCHIWTVLWNQYWCQEGLTYSNMEYSCFEFMKDKC